MQCVLEKHIPGFACNWEVFLEVQCMMWLALVPCVCVLVDQTKPSTGNCPCLARFLAISHAVFESCKLKMIHLLLLKVYFDTDQVAQMRAICIKYFR